MGFVSPGWFLCPKNWVLCPKNWLLCPQNWVFVSQNLTFWAVGMEGTEPGKGKNPILSQIPTPKFLWDSSAEIKPSIKLNS